MYWLHADGADFSALQKWSEEKQPLFALFSLEVGATGIYRKREEVEMHLHAVDAEGKH